MPAKKLNPQQQRDKRAKKMLIVLSVVLVVVMVIEVPTLLGGKKGSPSAAPATTDTSTSTTATTPSSAPSSASLASASIVATPQAGQLTRFGRFGGKDPFHPLVAVPTGGGGAGTLPSTPVPHPAGTRPANPPKPVGTPKTVTFAPTPAAKPTAQPTGPMVLGAVLTLNGTRQVVPVGAQFPTANPVFKLVAVGRKAMWISLVGGSFGNGGQALKVDAGHPVKLVNTTADLNFVLALLKVKLVPKPPPAPAPTTTTSTSSTTTSSTSTSATTTNSLG